MYRYKKNSTPHQSARQVTVYMYMFDDVALHRLHALPHSLK